MEIKIKSPEDVCVNLSSGHTEPALIIYAPPLEIYMTRQRGGGRDGLLTCLSSPTAPAGATGWSPRERGETGSGEDITHTSVPTPAAHKPPTVKGGAAAEDALDASMRTQTIRGMFEEGGRGRTQPATESSKDTTCKRLVKRCKCGAADLRARPQCH